MTRVYGWRPDLPDKRDRYALYAAQSLETLPRSVDLSPQMPACWDQGSLGACTAFAIGGAVAYEVGQQEEAFTPSFLFTYWNERAMEGTTSVDAGAYIRDGAKVSAQLGVAPASLWPYDVMRYYQRPPKRAFKAALDVRVSSYARVRQTRNEICSVLAGGDTIVFGISVYESFESAVVAHSGLVPMPGPNEDLLGGHAVLMVGYNLDTDDVLCRNSWGEEWGREGYFRLPFEYVLDRDLADDLWTLKAVTP